MKPFRFFFGLSLAFFIFVFFARFFILALVAAAVLSTVFYVLRRVRSFFTGMTWREQRRNYHDLYANYPSLPEWRYEREHLQLDRRARRAERVHNYRTIQVQ